MYVRSWVDVVVCGNRVEQLKRNRNLPWRPSDVRKVHGIHKLQLLMTEDVNRTYDIKASKSEKDGNCGKASVVTQQHSRQSRSSNSDLSDARFP